jgi:hypothetical protein
MYDYSLVVLAIPRDLLPRDTGNLLDSTVLYWWPSLVALLRFTSQGLVVSVL